MINCLTKLKMNENKKREIKFLEFTSKFSVFEIYYKTIGQLTVFQRYLTLLDGAKLITYLSDENKNVLSLPPLTNSDSTRVIFIYYFYKNLFDFHRIIKYFRCQQAQKIF